MREHFRQVGRQKAQEEVEAELRGSTTPPSSPRETTTPRGEEHSDSDNSPALFEALKLFTAASRQGHVQAQYTLGLCYATGTGRGGIDESSAFPWLLLSAQQVPLNAFHLLLLRLIDITPCCRSALMRTRASVYMRARRGFIWHSGTWA